jgi:DNA-binding GntR family transcriptional regulator
MVIERPLTIVEQASQILRKRIREGVYAPGERLPSEDELAEEMGISRTTLRAAMSALVAEGLVVRRQGAGTYVNRRSLELIAQLQKFWSFMRVIENGGRKPSVRQLFVGERAADQDEARHLEIEAGEMVFVLERLFLADVMPVIHSTNLVPLDLLTQPPQSRQLIESIQDFLRQHAGQEITYSTSDICAVLPPPEVAKALRVQDGQPLLRFDDVFFNASSKPIAYGINYYNEKLLGMRLVRTHTN